MRRSKEKGSFNSVAEQSGIKAGAGGFDIQVTGNTDLKGGVIASGADAAKNRLSTGTLSASDIVNTESYKASQIGLSGGIAGIGANKNASPPPQNTGNDGQPDARVGSGGNAIPGIKTGIGTISAGAPSILAASGGQSGTTNSAIAPATIIIAAGPNGAQDAASQAIANSISRDTASANDGALTQEFDAAKRADVQQGFAAAKALTQQTAMFFANRAAEEQAKKDEATRKEAELAQGIRLGADLKPLLDSNNNRIALTDAERALYNGDAKTEGSVAYLNAQARSLNATFGAGSPARILATALNGAAGSNTAGSLGALAQSAAVNVLQSLAVSEVKNIADGTQTKTIEADGTVTRTPNAQSEAIRAALQAVVGCAGATAGGSGNCTSAAVGASASVVVNNILTSLLNDDPSATLGGQQARTNLVANIAGVLTGALGGDAQSAALAAQIESENNYLTRSQILDRNAQVKRCDGDQACIDRVNDRFASL
jgi:filamentous hemagglutinin